MARQAGQFVIPAGPSSSTVLRRLERALPPGARGVLQTLHAHGMWAMLVGGAVRDAAMGQPPTDWDIVTQAPVAHLLTLFKRISQHGVRHGTVMVLTATGPVEVTSCRDAQGSIVADLLLRDLTINAMAADLPGKQWLDPAGGARDLLLRRLRCPGDATARFAEDPLRTLRVARFAATLGMRCTASTRAAMRAAAPQLSQVAAERKRDELLRLLSGRFVATGLALLDQTALAAHVHAHLRPLTARSRAAVARLPPDDSGLRLTAWLAGQSLPMPQLRGALDALKLSRRQGRCVTDTIQALALLPARPPRGAVLRQWVARVTPEVALAAAAVQVAYRPQRYAGFTSRVRDVLRHRCVAVSQLAIGGEDLRTLGLTGARLGAVLQQLLEQVLVLPKRNEKALLLRAAHKLSTGIL